ncbi:MAG TPA: hypothetical protein VF620_10155 [Allosphingosinicella sp.]|jgi:hypothetical protein
MDEVPSDEFVVETVQKHGGTISPTTLLKELVDGGHTPANSQRAMQRCLERGKIKFDLNLNVHHLAMAA